MSSGIYLYYDTKENSVVYVGRDSNIGKNKRHRDHMAKYNYDKQPFDRILQNNPDRYKYIVFCEGSFSNEELNNLEIQTIKLFNTFHREDAFNYTEGGDGTVGFEQTEETRKKISDAHKKNYARVVKKGFNSNGKQNYALIHDGKIIIQNINKEELEEVADEINKDKETIEQIIEKYSPYKKKYARVIKEGFNSNGKQKYVLICNGKRRIYNIYKEKLEKKADKINKLENKDDETIRQILEEK